ncbi:DUF1028 domain-containing protein [Qingshengfaniella alkalisoli]|uniref:DUF1028 domain-containing protein n=1 Tax=Qingshengfaniella alkalisoli TaxID=2599296 RepID=A0A5B8J8H4_9RHOB|nr:DUF1028 domain-containing protein [Qingshengfaniella alkalisoli]QDY70757.1 DUF1028 domain-containing protein [Qingshengfaniella alkalisoli]
MTISILARDEKSGTVGGAAMTGNLCVGAWVLRADPTRGITASQGFAPSTLWGEAALSRLGDAPPADVIDDVVKTDAGRAWRQLGALDMQGRGAAFTGARNIAVSDHTVQPGLVICGNLLLDETVVASAADAFVAHSGPFPERLLAALKGALAAGGDSRGTQSAALKIVGPKTPPLDLRVDYGERPLDDLAALLQRTAAPDYAKWLSTLPTAHRPENAPSG